MRQLTDWDAISGAKGVPNEIFMLSAKYFSKIGDAGFKLRHITALRLPFS
jgi:hypothetical protein